MFAACTLRAVQPAKPNIVIIFTDDQGYADVGAYGAVGFTTPHLDRLAREGVRFTDFHVAQAVCSASRAALLTGCYSNRVGIQGALAPGSRVGLSESETTLAEMLRPLGYATAAIGKWHLGDARPFLPLRHGFDEFLGLPYSADMWPLNSSVPPGRFPPLPLIEGDTPIISSLTPTDQEQLTTRYAARAVDFIGRNRDRPFFLYVAPNQPHVPLFVSEKFRGKSKRGLYGDVIMELDWLVGEILGALRAHHLDENTLVVFSSDNGPWLVYGDHAGSAGNLREGKATAFEGGHREPFIARWPGRIPAGTVCTEPAMSIDLLPTIARLTGASLPAKKIDGLDIWPLLAGEPGAKNPHNAYFFYYAPNELRAVRQRDWKLVLPHTSISVRGQTPARYGLRGKTIQEKVGLALYNLRDDLGETTDLADTHPDVVTRLLAFAEDARGDLGDDLIGLKGSGQRPPDRLRSAP